MQRFFVLAAALLAPAAAVAQDHPPFLPSRDVVVDYVTESPSLDPKQPHTLRLFSADKGLKRRMETPALQGYMILDLSVNRMTMVMADRHMYMEQPIDPARAEVFMLNDKMGFVRTGKDVVAGVACTVWQVQRPGGAANTACITDDGVLLRGEATDAAGGHTRLTATAVTYGPLADSMFQAPADFQKLPGPQGGPLGGRPPGAPVR